LSSSVLVRFAKGGGLATDEEKAVSFSAVGSSASGGGLEDGRGFAGSEDPTASTYET